MTFASSKKNGVLKSLSRVFCITLLSVALGTVICTTSTVHAQTKETLHKQNPNQAQDQVHVFGNDSYADKSFGEQYAHPETLSTFGHIFDETFWHISNEGLVCISIITLILLICATVFRFSPKRRAKYYDGTSRAAVIGTILGGIAVFVFLDVPLIQSSYKHTHEVMWNYPTGPDVVKIMIMPQQWAWNVKFPGIDGKFNTDDDIDTVNDIRVPVGKKVLIELKSKDVIHGFMIPNLRYQIDAIPGHITKFWFDTTRTGDFELACYHLCGTSHYKMKGFLKVMPQDEFDAWVKENSEWAKAKFDPEDKQVHWGWLWGAEGALTPTNTESGEKTSAIQLDLQPVVAKK